MGNRHRKRQTESLEEMRVRVLMETSVFLTECLRHPELAVRIPIIPVGRGEFPRSLAAAFWEPILSD